MLGRGGTLESKLRALLTLVMVVSLMGCRTMQISEGPTLPSGLENLHTGDVATVTTYAGTVSKFRVKSIDRRTLTGQNDNVAISIPVSQIKSVAISKVSVGKTVALSIVGVALAVLAIMGFQAFGQALGDAFGSL
jgi:hypothetical protein